MNSYCFSRNKKDCLLGKKYLNVKNEHVETNQEMKYP